MATQKREKRIYFFISVFSDECSINNNIPSVASLNNDKLINPLVHKVNNNNNMFILPMLLSISISIHVPLSSWLGWFSYTMSYLTILKKHLILNHCISVPSKFLSLYTIYIYIFLFYLSLSLSYNILTCYMKVVVHAKCILEITFFLRLIHTISILCS